ncbi:MAG: NUDIX domain-containing protein [Rikenellaceae bacterium]|jgi:ADP-ribose pyrophosphatase YjhB (NUDIX family)|nr:NUDIX domain-containing protein [Rikenellaceae bacterium]
MRVYFRDKVINFLQNPQPAGLNCFSEELDVASLLELAGDARDVTVVVPDPEETFRRFATQFVQVEAAGGVVRGSSGRVLMIFRRGLWDLPKGHREQGETMAGCALREVEEECGVSGMAIERELCVTSHFYRAGRQWEMKRTAWYAMAVEGDPAPHPQHEEGISRARWMTPAECIAASMGSYATIRDVVGEYFAR